MEQQSAVIFLFSASIKLDIVSLQSDKLGPALRPGVCCWPGPCHSCILYSCTQQMEQRSVPVTAWAKVLEPHDISRLSGALLALLKDLLWIGGAARLSGLVWLRSRGWGWSWLFCGSWLLYRIWSSQLLLLILDVALIHTWQITSLLGRQNHRKV